MDLEVKLAFLEHHLLELDQLVRGQAARLDAVEGELRALREEQRSGLTARSGLLDDVPPHHGRPTDLG